MKLNNLLIVAGIEPSILSIIPNFRKLWTDIMTRTVFTLMCLLLVTNISSVNAQPLAGAIGASCAQEEDCNEGTCVSDPQSSIKTCMSKVPLHAVCRTEDVEPGTKLVCAEGLICRAPGIYSIMTLCLPPLDNKN